MSKYKQLTYEQRCQIEVLLKRGLSQREIANSIGVSQPMVSRELKRNRGLRGYRHEQAQEKAEVRRYESAKAQKLNADLLEFINEKLHYKRSLEQISGYLRINNTLSLIQEWIYQYIWQNKRDGGDLYTNLRRHGKRYQYRGARKAGRGFIKSCVRIEHRPKIVDKKSRVGDWEIDTVIGKGHSDALVTIVERKTQFTLSKQVMCKTVEAVRDAIISLLTPFKNVLHTITVDNGKEFAYHEEITEALGV